MYGLQNLRQSTVIIKLIIIDVINMLRRRARFRHCRRQTGSQYPALLLRRAFGSPLRPFQPGSDKTCCHRPPLTNMAEQPVESIGPVGPILRGLEARVRAGGMSRSEEDEMFTLGMGPCVMCSGVGFSAVPSNFSRALAAAAVERPYPGAPCVCQGPRRVPGVTNAHLVACWDMWMRLAARRPWDRLRMRHVVRVEAPWVKGGWQYVQVYGGSHTVDPAIRIARSEREVGNERGYYNPHGMCRRFCVVVAP